MALGQGPVNLPLVPVKWSLFFFAVWNAKYLGTILHRSCSSSETFRKVQKKWRLLCTPVGGPLERVMDKAPGLFVS